MPIIQNYITPQESFFQSTAHDTEKMNVLFCTVKATLDQVYFWLNNPYSLSLHCQNLPQKSLHTTEADTVTLWHDVQERFFSESRGYPEYFSNFGSDQSRAPIINDFLLIN